MKILEFVKDYIEEKGINFLTQEDFDSTVGGIKKYLADNGIDETEEREYYQKFVSRHMKMINDRDIKGYFQAYEDISIINQLVAKARSNEELTKDDRDMLLKSYERTVYFKRMGEYIPKDEVNLILGLGKEQEWEEGINT